MRIKVDEDLPSDAISLLRRHGYHADSVLDESLGGSKDPALWQAIQADGRFLVTADKGFGNALRYPPGTHAGILLLRPDEDGIRPLLRLLEAVLAGYRLDDIVGAITIASPRSIRVRRTNAR